MPNDLLTPPPQAYIKNLPPGAIMNAARAGHGVSGSWDQTPIDENPSETAIPRAWDALKQSTQGIGETVTNPISSELEGTKTAFGKNDGGLNADDQSLLDSMEEKQPSMGDTLKQAGKSFKETVTNPKKLGEAAARSGSQALQAVSGIKPISYATRAASGDYAGAAGEALGDVATAGVGLAAAHRFASTPPLAGEHPSIAAQAVDAHAKNNGSTFDPRTGENLHGTNKWAVSVVPEATHVSETAPTPDEYSNYVATHRDLLARNPNAQVGTWFDPQTNLHHMDITATTSSKNAAMRAAKELGEQGIYHLGKDEFVPGENAGNRPVAIPGSIDDRFSLLRTAEPPKTPFSGVHYSATKLDNIDGGRRGQPDPSQPGGRSAGQEGERVRMGDTTGGKGPNGVPGFYAYQAGSLPEPVISSSRKFVHSVKDNLALANIAEEPEWQSGLQKGYQDAISKGAYPAEASALAINSAEHALQDAGFDGYYHPDTPNTKFIFGSHETSVVGAPPKSYQSPGGKLSSEAGVARLNAERKGLGAGKNAATQQPDIAATAGEPVQNPSMSMQREQPPSSNKIPLPSNVDTRRIPADTRADSIAQAYEGMQHNPNDPKVRASYDSLINSVRKQYNFATKDLGIKIDPTDADPSTGVSGYKNAQAMIDDVNKNRHLNVWTGGDLPKDHPLNQIDPKTGLQLNTMFRAVHDIFGHAAEGHDFSETGEENAYNIHKQMFPTDAVPALTTETKGQLYALLHGKGVREGTPLGDNPEFPPQKANLLPNEFSQPDPNAHLRDNGDPASLLSANERAQIDTKTRKAQFYQTMKSIPAVKDFVAAAQKGEVGQNWYDRSIAAFDAMRSLSPQYFKPEDADRFSGVVAATSPQQAVASNLREALNFWRGWNDAGRPMDAKTIKAAQRAGQIPSLTNQDSKLPNLIKALNGEDLLPGDRDKYYKVGNFANNLSGMMNHVTNDSWMGVFSGQSESQVPKPQVYHALALRTRQAAAELGWKPAQAQAAIWVFTKTLAEMSGWKAAGGNYYRPTNLLPELTPEKMSRYASDFADIMKNDTEVRGRLSELGIDTNELDKRLSKIVAKPQGATYSPDPKSLSRNAGRIGAAQQKLTGFTEYSRKPVAQKSTSFDFGANPVQRAAAASKMR